jgi:hypothetical protein
MVLLSFDIFSEIYLEKRDGEKRESIVKGCAKSSKESFGEGRFYLVSD